MKKVDPIQSLMDSNDLSKFEAEKIVILFFDEMSEALSQEDRVETRGLFSFFINKYGGDTGRNPKIGEKVRIKPKKLAFFELDKELKERVDG
jgi:integration host factor subunit beta